jgi:hypothetical protein
LERGEVDDPKQPPRTGSYVADLGSVLGVRRELANILENESGRDGYVKRYARLNYAQIRKKEAQRKWQKHLHAQPNLPNDTPPSGHWARDIARWRAQELVCECESRALHKRLRELEQEEKEKQKSRKKLGVVKLRDSQPHLVDGRELIQRVDGEYVLKDGDQLLKDYLTEVKASRKKQLEKKRAETAAACAACK